MSREIIPAPPLVPSPQFLRSAVWRTAICWIPILLAACAPPRINAPDVAVSLIADNQRQDLQIAPGTTVADVLAQAGIELGPLDRVTPPMYSLIADGSTVRVIRVLETFEVEQVSIPFQRQIVRNEALPPDETRLVQAGEEGLQEITYRILTEDGVETSRTPLRTTQLKEPVPEILMVGAASSFATVSIPGTLAYLDGGNAWMMREDSGNRCPLAASADLDSRIFALSPDGEWLLFSRLDPTHLNGLYAVAASGEEQPFALYIFDVIHFAEWSPSDQRTIAFSTVRSVSAAPGWQANNDLRVVSYDKQMVAVDEQTVMASNAEGSYSWWGTKFAWSPDGTKLAYARPDEIGWIARTGGKRHPLLAFTPYFTQADWIWLPAIRWSPDGAFLITIHHAGPVGSETPEESPSFHVAALPAGGGEPIILFENSGMFGYPAPGPLRALSSEQGYNLAFLQADRPLESDRSRYRLMVSDRDGSNVRTVFPPEGEPGLAPGEAGGVEWSPDGKQIALIYEGNLWIINLATGEGHQLTGDGRVTMIDWR